MNHGQLALELGAIPAYNMNIESIVTKLSYLIGNGYSYNEIQEKMIISLKGEIEVK